MRLIDADARVTVQSFDPMNEEYNHDKMTVERALDFATDEGCPPIIEAIPVKWLRRWRDVTDIPLLAMNIDSILKVWEESNKYWGEVNKKQEAR